MATLKLTRPITGIENRTPQEVFDIMCDRIKSAAKSDLRAGMEKAAEIAEKMQREVDELEETYAREKLPAIVLDPNGDQIAAAIRQAAEEA